MREFDEKTVEFLISDEGNRIVKIAEKMDLSRVSGIERLREICPSRFVGAVIDLVRIRRKAGVKFSLACRMIFDSVGYEQSTGEIISGYKAERVRSKVGEGTIVDLCCGVGGDTVGFARGGAVIGIDKSVGKVKMARFNVGVYGGGGNATFACADVRDIKVSGSVFHIDPDQRRRNVRSFRLEDIEPGVEVINRLVEDSQIGGLIKLSSGVDYRNFPWDGEIEVVSVGGECKQMIVWVGDFAEVNKRATILPERVSITDRVEPGYDVSDVKNYVYDPDPAVSRLKLIVNLAGLYGFSFLAPGQVLITSDKWVKTPFAKGYKVIDVFPFHISKLKRYFRANPARVVVKPRGIKVEVEKIASQLSSPRADMEVFCFLARIDKKVIAILTQKGS